MQVTYSTLQPVQKTVEVDENDLATLNDIVVDSYLNRLSHFSLRTCVTSWEEKAAKLCRKYGVNPEDRNAVYNFYKAMLGR